MIISKTPLRMSFVGGASDIKDFYKDSYGAVVSTAIDKFIYITANKKFDNHIRVSYSKTEIVDSVNNLKHELVRESLRELNIEGSVEITSISDIPSVGTGLGSSSSFTVGTINALRAFLGKHSTSNYLAETACKIEIEKCKHPIGKQDQYAAAFGGFNYIKFNPDDSVLVEPIVCPQGTLEKLQNNLLMLYTNRSRSANGILQKQQTEITKNSHKKIVLRQMVQLAEEMRSCLSKGDTDGVGDLLDINWSLKKQLADNISDEEINNWYSLAKRNGALGGKILGAGGGGFLLVYAPRHKHQAISKALKTLKSVKFQFEPTGSRIIFSD